MNIVEKLSIATRHTRYLKDAGWLWGRLRPSYERLIALAGRKGLRRVMNGTDPILISPQCRGLTEEYEPEVWSHLMAETKVGDVIADVGAYIGIYTVALAKRIGPSGRVIAFEPDANNLAILRTNLHLNAVEDCVEIVTAAVGTHNGVVEFFSNLSESHIASGPSDGAAMNGNSSAHLARVRLVTLDSVFAEGNVDLLKIDVEGHEEMVLRGGPNLLADPSRAPRRIFIEVHPYAWPALGLTSESLLRCLAEYGYQVKDLKGNPLQKIEHYGEIVAHKSGEAAPPDGIGT